MTYSLYLDDVRDPKTQRDWHVVRSYSEFTETILRLGVPAHISFDHDLGEDTPSGYDCAKWLVEHCIDNDVEPSSFTSNIHSANPIGADNIRGLLASWARAFA